MSLRLYRSILSYPITLFCFLFLLLFAGIPLSAQNPPAPAPPKPIYLKIAAPSDWVTNVPLGTVIACGDGANFTNIATTTASQYPSTGFEATCNLYVQEGATAFSANVNIFPSMALTAITIPAIGPPPPPPPAPPTPPAYVLSSIWQLMQSSTPGVQNEVQITCVPMGSAVPLPAGVTLPLYGTPPILCVFAIVQGGTPIVPPPTAPPAPPAAASK